MEAEAGKSGLESKNSIWLSCQFLGDAVFDMLWLRSPRALSGKDCIISTLGLVGQTVPVTTPQLCHYGRKAATDIM